MLFVHPLLVVGCDDVEGLLSVVVLIQESALRLAEDGFKFFILQTIKNYAIKVWIRNVW